MSIEWPWKPKKSDLKWIAQFHRPWAMRFFAFVNFVIAVYYAGLGSFGILQLMFGGDLISDRITFDDMIQLLGRSLNHSMIAGAVLVADFVMEKAVFVFALKGGAQRSD